MKCWYHKLLQIFTNVYVNYLLGLLHLEDGGNKTSTILPTSSKCKNPRTELTHAINHRDRLKSVKLFLKSIFVTLDSAFLLFSFWCIY
jgi:hypothetical protein